jgi:hypothetical protein
MTDEDIREYHQANQELLEIKLQAGINGWRKDTEKRFKQLERLIELYEQKKERLQ